MIFNQTLPAQGGGSDTAHGIYCADRDSFELPSFAETGETVTVRCIKGGMIGSFNVTMTTNSSNSDVLGWSPRPPIWSVGMENTFVMPDSDVTAHLFA